MLEILKRGGREGLAIEYSAGEVEVDLNRLQPATFRELEKFVYRKLGIQRSEPKENQTVQRSTNSGLFGSRNL